MTNKRDVYIAIMRAAARGEGIRLSADECFDLSLDDAIALRHKIDYLPMILN